MAALMTHVVMFTSQHALSRDYQGNKMALSTGHVCLFSYRMQMTWGPDRILGIDRFADCRCRQSKVDNWFVQYVGFEFAAKNTIKVNDKFEKIPLYSTLYLKEWMLSDRQSRFNIILLCESILSMAMHRCLMSSCMASSRSFISDCFSYFWDWRLKDQYQAINHKKM